MNDLNSFLSKFLETINYSDDKQEFINKLISVIYGETVEELTKTLPTERQALIRQTFESAKTPVLLQKAVSEAFDLDLFNETIKKTSQKVFNDYLQTIDPALTPDQKVKLQQYFTPSQP